MYFSKRTKVNYASLWINVVGKQRVGNQRSRPDSIGKTIPVGTVRAIVNFHQLFTYTCFVRRRNFLKSSSARTPEVATLSYRLQILLSWPQQSSSFELDRSYHAVKIHTYWEYCPLKPRCTFQPSLFPLGFRSEAKTVLFEPPHIAQHVYSLWEREIRRARFLFHEIYSGGKARTRRELILHGQNDERNAKRWYSCDIAYALSFDSYIRLAVPSRCARCGFTAAVLFPRS